MEKEYSKLRFLGSICFQIILIRGYEVIHLLPQISLAFNNRDVYFAIGAEWILGTVNLGYSKKSHVEYWTKTRKQEVDKLAKQNGITYRQQELKYGW